MGVLVREGLNRWSSSSVGVDKQCCSSHTLSLALNDLREMFIVGKGLIQ